MQVVKLVYRRGTKQRRWVYPKPYNFLINDEIANDIDPLNNALIITTGIDEQHPDQRVFAFVLAKPTPATGDEDYTLLGDDTVVKNLTAEDHRTFARFLEAMAKKKINGKEGNNDDGKNA